jgi:hypothetical protein
MANSLTELNLCNQALRLFGGGPVTNLAVTNDNRVTTWNEHYATTRDELLESHFWNWATVRTTLLRYTAPAAILTPGAGATVILTTGVTFTASVAVFAASDVGRSIKAVSPAVGEALITGFTSATVVTATIVTAFASLAAIASQAWRLYNPTPSWGFGFSLSLPADYLRMQRIRYGTIYQREGNYILTNFESLDFTYTQRVTDITQWPAYFVTAVVAAMVTKLVEPGTGQRSKQVDWFQIADRKLARAKLLDGMEGSPPILRANDLAIARFGGGPVRTTEE